MNLSTVKWAQWDKTQSRELLVCSYVCASHCAQLLHTILHRTDLIVFPLPSRQSPLLRWCLFEGRGENGNITSYRIVIKRERNKRILIWRHAWRRFPKNSYTKTTTKVLLFSILRHNLSKFITQTGLYCNKQIETTFSSILWKLLHITFKGSF